MVDAFDRLSGRLATHHDGRAYDRVIVSDAIANGLAGLQLEEVIIGRHRHGRREDRVVYTDHFPLNAKLMLCQVPGLSSRVKLLPITVRNPTVPSQLSGRHLPR